MKPNNSPTKNLNIGNTPMTSQRSLTGQRNTDFTPNPMQTPSEVNRTPKESTQNKNKPAEQPKNEKKKIEKLKTNGTVITAKDSKDQNSNFGNVSTEGKDNISEITNPKIKDSQLILNSNFGNSYGKNSQIVNQSGDLSKKIQNSQFTQQQSINPNNTNNKLDSFEDIESLIDSDYAQHKKLIPEPLISNNSRKNNKNEQHTFRSKEDTLSQQVRAKDTTSRSDIDVDKVFIGTPPHSLDHTNKPQLKTESIKFNFNLKPNRNEKFSEQSPVRIEGDSKYADEDKKSPSKNKMSGKYQNKLGFLVETSGSGLNTYSSEIPIVDWNNNSKIVTENNKLGNLVKPYNNQKKQVGYVNQNQPGALRNIQLDKSMIRKNKDFLDSSIRRIQQQTSKNQSLNVKSNANPQMGKQQNFNAAIRKNQEGKAKIQRKAYPVIEIDKSRAKSQINHQNTDIINRFDDFFKNMNIKQQNELKILQKANPSSQSARSRSKLSMYKGVNVTLDNINKNEQKKIKRKKDEKLETKQLVVEQKFPSIGKIKDGVRSGNSRSFRIKKSQTFSNSESLGMSQVIRDSKSSETKSRKRIRDFVGEGGQSEDEGIGKAKLIGTLKNQTGRLKTEDIKLGGSVDIKKKGEDVGKYRYMDDDEF